MGKVDDELWRLHEVEVKAEAEETAAQAEAHATGDQLKAARAEYIAASAAFISAHSKYVEASTRAREASTDAVQKLFAHFAATGEHTDLARQWFEHNQQRARRK